MPRIFHITSKTKKGFSRFFQTTSKTKQKRTPRFFQTCLKTRHISSPRILTRTTKKSKQNGFPRFFKRLQKPDAERLRDSFQLRHKQDNRSLQNSFKLLPQGVTEILSDYLKKKTKNSKNLSKYVKTKTKAIPEILLNYF